MTYKKSEINPVSGQRLKEEIKNRGLSQADFAGAVDLDPKYIGFMCNGIRAISPKRADQFSEILGVRPEYLLGLDDYRTYDLAWLNNETASGIRKQRFFEHCLAFWGYSIAGNETLTELDETDPEDPETVITGIRYKIKKPTGEIVEIDGVKYDRLQDEILRSTRRLLRETFDPEF